MPKRGRSIVFGETRRAMMTRADDVLRAKKREEFGAAACRRLNTLDVKSTQTRVVRTTPHLASNAAAHKTMLTKVYKRQTRRSKNKAKFSTHIFADRVLCFALCRKLQKASILDRVRRRLNAREHMLNLHSSANLPVVRLLSVSSKNRDRRSSTSKSAAVFCSSSSLWSFLSSAPFIAG